MTRSQPLSPKVLTRADLPANDTRRWVVRRKAQVVAAVRGGVLTLDEARERYMLSEEEFLSWERSLDLHGVGGLRTSKLKHYRNSR